MALEKYEVRLKREELSRLRQMIRSGRGSARAMALARILLKMDMGWTAPRAAAALDVSLRTVFRIKRRYAEEGLGEVLRHRTQVNPVPEGGREGGGPPGSPCLQSGTRGSRPLDPEAAGGQDGGTGAGGISFVRDGAAALEKNTLKPWRKQQWCIPKVSAEFVAHMEDVLDLYAEPYDPARPVVCFDESSTQLLAETREPLAAKPGRPRRQDYENVRNGTRNLFLTCEPKAGWHHVAVTERRTMQDFAQQMRWLVDEAYPDVQVVRLVLDNLKTHRLASLYEAFPAPEARRIAKRLQFHHTPKHGSWLNMAEMEFSVLARACLRGRNPDEDSLERAVNANVSERTPRRHPSTGASRPETPDANSTASTRAILDLT